MTFTISKRGLVRVISFSLAGLLVPSLLAWSWYQNAKHSQQVLGYQYWQSMSDLTAHVQNIDASLRKARYANTPPMLAALSSKLWREAGLAKASLASLPVEYLQLQNTNKLLSQVGDYCVTLSREFERGNRITGDQRQNLSALQDYCDTMLSEVLAATDSVQTGSVSLTADPGFSGAKDTPEIGDGFTEFEEGFTSYPTLIYDGPFSDHIMEREPEIAKDTPTVSRAEARKTALLVTGLPDTALSDGNDEEGKMPSYAFTGTGADVSVTKNGGQLCYLMKSRLVDQRNLSADAALEKAKAFLRKLGITGMETTYWEIADGKLTANFAYTEQDVTFYTDLIKVTVAMDNGEITGCDARGFLVNHRQRDKQVPTLTEAKAAQSVSPLLTAEKGRLCVIPGGGRKEVLCWEFRCKSETDETVLVYVNAATGFEEQLLILLISDNGQLTV